MGKMQLNVWVEVEQRAAIKAKAAAAGVSVGQLVVEAVLGVPDDPRSQFDQRLARVERDAATASEQASGVAESFDDLERRLSRLEEMAGGQY